MLKRCEHCGEKRDASEMHRAKIYFRNSREVWKSGGRDSHNNLTTVLERESFTDSYDGWFCKDGQCARNEQFSNEG